MKKIVVCVKQVPETTAIKINSENNTLDRNNIKSIINPSDLTAIEFALGLKQDMGAQIIVLSMGPASIEKKMRKLLSMGVDDVVLVCDKKLVGSDTCATSLVLSAAIKKIADVCLVLCGSHSIDGETAHVGPGVASLLKINQITNVQIIEKVEQDYIEVKKRTELNDICLRAAFPVLLTVLETKQRSIFGNLKLVNFSFNSKILVWSLDDLNIPLEKVGLKGSPTIVNKVFSPEVSASCKFIEVGNKFAVDDELVRTVFN